MAIFNSYVSLPEGRPARPGRPGWPGNEDQQEHVVSKNWLFRENHRNTLKQSPTETKKNNKPYPQSRDAGDIA